MWEYTTHVVYSVANIQVAERRVTDKLTVSLIHTTD